MYKIAIQSQAKTYCARMSWHSIAPKIRISSHTIIYWLPSVYIFCSRFSNHVMCISIFSYRCIFWLNIILNYIVNQFKCWMNGSEWVSECECAMCYGEMNCGYFPHFMCAHMLIAWLYSDRGTLTLTLAFQLIHLTETHFPLRESDQFQIKDWLCGCNIICSVLGKTYSQLL